MSMRNRVGRFSISRRLIDRHDPGVQSVMAEVVIVGCENNYASDRLEYVAYCAKFDELEEGHVVPWYDVEFTPGYGVRFTRREGDLPMTWEPREAQA